jgi:hypothetical protein
MDLFPARIGGGVALRRLLWQSARRTPAMHRAAKADSVGDDATYLVDGLK